MVNMQIDRVILLQFVGLVNEQFELVCMRPHVLTFENPQSKNLSIDQLRSINPLKESTTVVLQQEKLVSVKLHNIHTCKILLLTLL
jgi:hypothetical protein